MSVTVWVPGAWCSAQISWPVSSAPFSTQFRVSALLGLCFCLYGTESKPKIGEATRQTYIAQERFNGKLTWRDETKVA